jgi:hypothetical protein
MKTCFRFLILFGVFIFSVNPLALAVDIYSTGSSPKKLSPLSISDKAFEVTTFDARDTNFPAREKMEYSGISVDFIAKKWNMSPDTILTFLCKDFYLLAQTIGELSKTGALIAMKVNKSEIPGSLGGPVTMVHRVETLAELYPWYIESIFVGKIERPFLTIEAAGLSKTLNWSEISQKKNMLTKVLALPSPRGRRSMQGYDALTIPKISQLHLESLLKLPKFETLKVEYTSANGAISSKEYTSDSFKNVRIAVKRNDKEIQIYDGGPFVITDSDKVTENPVFYVTKIKFQTVK